MDPIMIISAVQVLASGDPQAVINHLRHGKENQRIHLLQGAWADVGDMFEDAANYRKKYSIQHLVVAPWEKMTRLQMMETALPMLAEKLKFPVCEAVVVEHERERSDPEAYPTHWHVIVMHFDPTSGKVRDWWNNHLKHELMARILEHRLGHRMLCGFYHDTVLDALRDEAQLHPQSDFGAVADALEAAWPRGSRPDGTTVSKAEIKKHEAVGRDLVALKKRCREAWAASADLDQFNAALAPIGLYAQISEAPPPKWMIYDGTGLVGTVAKMAHVKIDAVNLKLGDPANDDWYRNDDIEPDAALERGTDDPAAGADPASDPHADRAAEAVHQLADLSDGQHVPEAERAFEAEMNALPASRLTWCEDMAAWLTRSPWAYAMSYLEEKAQNALDYLKRVAIAPGPNTWLGWIRDKVAELKAALAAVETDEARETARKALKEQEDYGKSYEAEYSREVAEYRTSLRVGRTADLIQHANRHLRVVERCKALIDNDRGASILWIDPETLFEYGYEADRTAKPGARWKVAGPPDVAPDLDNPDGPTLPTLH